MKKNIILLLALLSFFARVKANTFPADTAKIRLSAKVHGGNTVLSRDSIHLDIELKNLSAQSVKLPDIFSAIDANTYIAVTQDNGHVSLPIQVSFIDYSKAPVTKYIVIGKNATRKFSLNLSEVLNRKHIVLATTRYTVCLTYMNNKGDGIKGTFDAQPIAIIIKTPPPAPKPAKLTGTFTDTRDRQVYKWVKIGNQIWMAQNLNYKTPEHSYVYNNDEANRAKYGMYYDFQVLQDIAPKGWHVPSDAEWQQMEISAGLSADQASADGYRGDMAAALLPGGESGFNLLYAGWHKQGFFDALDQTAYFWTTTQSGAPVYGRMLKKGYNSIYRNRWGIAYGMSIRCVKDEPSPASGNAPKKDDVLPAEKQIPVKTQTVISNVVTFTTKKDTLSVKPFKPLTRSKNKIGFFVDARDGQRYSWVKIGKLVWMAENLNYHTRDGHSYYPDSDTTNANKYGMLYDFVTLKNVCPSGWHIPSNEEWNKLEISGGIPADQLKPTGWHGDDISDFIPGGTTGFDVLYTGERKGSRTIYLNERAYFWTTWDEDHSYIFRRIFMKDYNRIMVATQGTGFALSVRCVKDESVK